MSDNPYLDQVRKWVTAHHKDDAKNIKALPDELFSQLYEEYCELGPEPEKVKKLTSVFQRTTKLFTALDPLSYEHAQLSRATTALMKDASSFDYNKLTVVVSTIYRASNNMRGIFAINCFRLEASSEITKSYKALTVKNPRYQFIDDLTLGFLYIALVDESSAPEAVCSDHQKAAIKSNYNYLKDLVQQLELVQL